MQSTSQSPPHTPGIPNTALTAGTPLGKKYTTHSPANATINPVNFSTHVWKNAAVINNIHHMSAATETGTGTPLRVLSSFSPSTTFSTLTLATFPSRSKILLPSRNPTTTQRKP